MTHDYSNFINDTTKNQIFKTYPLIIKIKDNFNKYKYDVDNIDKKIY